MMLCYNAVKRVRQIRRRYYYMLSTQLINEVVIDWEKIGRGSYLRDIPALCDVERISFTGTIISRRMTPTLNSAMRSGSRGAFAVPVGDIFCGRKASTM